MHNYWLLFLMVNVCAFVQTLQADSTVLNETFETGMPTTLPSSETNVLLSSGTWTLNGVYGKTDNGSPRACMNATNGYLVLPAIDKPASISFNHRGSGSNKVLNVEKSLDNGLNWTAVGTATVSSSSTYGSSSMQVGEPGTKAVLIRFVCTSATIYVDNVCVSAS
ncbi:MAG: hypothetical protein Q8914_04825, partial [Bacteroidota bacterium]|nr:hypothetical protein [Bacteroidota bacterium]